MKKSIFILTFFLFSTHFIFAKTDLKLPVTDDEVKSLYNQLTEKNPAFEGYSLINSFEVTDDEILFLDITNPLTKHRKVISMNTSRSDESEVLIDFHGYKNWGRVSMCYSSKSDRLFVETYGQGLFIEGKEVLYDSGFYVFNRVNGKFTRAGMERVFALPSWLVSDVKRLYLNREQPDYKALLDWFYYYCDNGEKEFVFDASDGIRYTGEKGLKKYMEENYGDDDSLKLATYFRKIKDGKITEESALSCVLKAPQSYPRNLEYQPYNAKLIKTDDGIWLFVEIGVQQIDEEGKTFWKTAYMKPYLLEDSNGQYPELRNNPLNGVQITATEDEIIATVQNLYGMLLYKENDSGKWIIYKGGEKYGFDSYEEAEHSAKNLYEGNFKIKPVEKRVSMGQNILFIIICFIAILELIIIIFMFSKAFSRHLNKKDKRFIFKIQEAERTKLSHDIHDSVVQNIRAIRLEAEMLQVSEEQEVQKQKIVQEMTDVIALLRNICYNFRPAELSVQTDNTELISIIDTLCQQFIARTKIPCQIQIQKDFVPPKIDTEKSTNIVRAVQEALANIEKHSYATKVQIVIKSLGQESEKRLEIFIIDDGIGCEVSKLGRGKMNFGIRNMKERIEACGGEIDFFSTPNEGLTVQLRVPYE